MNARHCEAWQDRLPELAGGLLSHRDATETKAHLRECESCRDEYEVVRAVRLASPPIPPGLEARIQGRVREEFLGAEEPDGSGHAAAEILPLQPRFRVSTWGLSAAAVVILALGTGLIWTNRSGDVVQEPIVVAAQEAAPEAWLWDDGMVAGAPVYDGLSDEDLEALLEEFEGGA